ncbi:PREDICTED: G-box-binding factor 3-like isoform X1 [Camelina sativa]|uniref:G-box-binding factor 3-like isoform X1 n=1 Tax=Camelina sativa TaxID=90675 RepID=A0ABM0YVV4_CAMSA|nr:PREDICTED: G-box-binding factor 3-like isoform X1 [Camelina sativa]
MGNNSEEPKPTKSDNKPSSPPDQTNVHVYPDWAAMQAYYGPRVAMPPYYNSAMAASGHPPPPPYMWNPQHMMSPYESPYAAVYQHGGGVYPHPGIPMGSQPQGQKAPPLTTPGTHLSIATPTKSTGNTDNGLMKKLKEFDGLAMSLGNGNPETGADEHKRSRNSSETDGSSDGSDGNTTGADEPKPKRSREGTPTKDGKQLAQSSSLRSASLSSGDTGIKVIKGAGAVVSPGVSANSNPFMSQSLAMVPPETWPQNERELKRERRKQSNRESARRSRLRKQAETEELAKKVEALTAENMALRSELNQLNEKSDKLRGANATLLDKLKCSEPEKRVSGNMLSRIKNSGAGDKNKNQGDNDSNSTSKLHQLLDTKPRANAVAAG